MQAKQTTLRNVASKQKANRRAATENGSRKSAGSKRGAETAAELTARNIQAIVQCEDDSATKEPLSQIVAQTITRFFGSMPFVWVHVVWFGGWILANLTLPPAWRLDPVPFPFLTLVVSLEAIFLSTFILITENRQSALAERRAHLDLQINMLAEQENTKMLELLERIAAKVGVPPVPDAEMKAMQETTEPKKVLAQIDKAIESKTNGASAKAGRNGKP